MRFVENSFKSIQKYLLLIVHNIQYTSAQEIYTKQAVDTCIICTNQDINTKRAVNICTSFKWL